MSEVVEKKSKWGKVGKVAIIFFTFILLAAGFAYSRTDLGEAAGKYEGNLSEAKRLGLITTEAELANRYAIPSSDNGAELVAGALPKIALLRKDGKDSLPDSQLESKWIEFEPWIVALEAASQRKSLIFKHDRSKLPLEDLSESSYVKEWVGFLVRSARLAVKKNQVEKASRCLNLAAFLSSSADDEGTFLGMLVRDGCASMIERVLREMVPKLGGQPAWLKVIDSTLNRLDQPYDFRAALQVEHFMDSATVVPLVNNPKKFYKDIGGGDPDSRLIYARFFPRMREASLARLSGGFIAAMKDLPNDPYDFNGVQKSMNHLDDLGGHAGLSYLASRGVIFPSREILHSIRKEVGQRNALIQAVAIIKRKANPQSGLPLTGHYRLDADGKPIRIRRKGSGWIVYSVWGDMTDDKGLESTNNRGDWVVHLPIK